MKATFWVETIGIIAVVISMGLLTWEINQANSLAQSNVYSDVSRHYNEVNLLMASSQEFAEIWVALVEVDAELTSIDAQRAMGLSFWHRNIWNSVEFAYREGWISTDKFQNTLNDVKSEVGTGPGIRPYLRTVVESLGKDTELTEVESLVLEITQPNGQQ